MALEFLGKSKQKWICWMSVTRFSNWQKASLQQTPGDILAKGSSLHPGCSIRSRFCLGECIFLINYDHEEDWLLEGRKTSGGTAVWLKLNNHTSRTAKKVFGQFTSGEVGNYGFTKTVVPVKLAQYGNDKLISRSQAKRVVARIELFKTVLFDFTDVSTIGQAFADEIFRVFANDHPEIDILPSQGKL